jgi:hypothetical protein
MNSPARVRITLMTLAVIVGGYGLASMIAELTAAPRPAFPTNPTNIVAPADVPAWLDVIPLVRSDLASNHALSAALRAIQRGKLGRGEPIENDRARSRVRQALSLAPYDAELWLALALLETHHDPGGPAASEALKMAYFTAPSDARLMPVRLDTATVADALIDPDLTELARGDVRLMLTRRPEQRTALIQVYRRASKRGKAFLQQAVQAIDPSFVAILRS